MTFAILTVVKPDGETRTFEMPRWALGKALNMTQDAIFNGKLQSAHVEIVDKTDEHSVEAAQRFNDTFREKRGVKHYN